LDSSSPSAKKRQPSEALHRRTFVRGDETVHMSLLLRIILLSAALTAQAAQTFRVGTYNVQNYLLEPIGTRPAKSEASRAKVRESIRALNADVLALQEIGGTNALLELREGLRRDGVDYPHWEVVHAWDTNIQVAVLSKFPITARTPHTNDSFVLLGKQHRVKRGFAEVRIEVNRDYSFVLFTAHLKSKLTAFEADEQELREQEAEQLRKHVDHLLNSAPNANVIVAGDLNDTQESRAVRTIIGRKNALIDTRPCEANDDSLPNNNPRYPAPRITWTHFYAKEDSFRRIDYLLISRGMAREWVTNQSCVLKLPNWGVASDHRPIAATFYAENR
jgi:endonuclease/exonuclease/phosphatase family metal-dependent hydrolase